MTIIAQTHDGKPYFTTTKRGVAYTARLVGTGWELHVRRLALGRSNVGSYRFYSTFDDLEINERAFWGLRLLLGIGSEGLPQ